jgi:hypothetical protein
LIALLLHLVVPVLSFSGFGSFPVRVQCQIVDRDVSKYFARVLSDENPQPMSIASNWDLLFCSGISEFFILLALRLNSTKLIKADHHLMMHPNSESSEESGCK